MKFILRGYLQQILLKHCTDEKHSKLLAEDAVLTYQNECLSYFVHHCKLKIAKIFHEAKLDSLPFTDLKNITQMLELQLETFKTFNQRENT